MGEIAMALDSTTVGVLVLILLALFAIVFITWTNTRQARRHTRQIFQQQKLARNFQDVHRLSQAVHLLRPTVRLGFDYTIKRDGSGGNPYVSDWEAGGTEPEQTELADALARVSEVDSRGYAAMRRSEYPSMEDQLDAAYKARHGNDTEQQKIDRQIEEIKSKYPKSDAEL